MKIETPKFIESKHEGHRIEHDCSFSPKFGELLGFISPGPGHLISHMASPRFPNEKEVIHVYCDTLAPCLIGKQSVHWLDTIPSRGMFT